MYFQKTPKHTHQNTATRRQAPRTPAGGRHRQQREAEASAGRAAAAEGRRPPTAGAPPDRRGPRAPASYPKAIKKEHIPPLWPVPARGRRGETRQVRLSRDEAFAGGVDAPDHARQTGPTAARPPTAGAPASSQAEPPEASSRRHSAAGAKLKRRPPTAAGPAQPQSGGHPRTVGPAAGAPAHGQERPGNTV